MEFTEYRSPWHTKNDIGLFILPSGRGGKGTVMQRGPDESEIFKEPSPSDRKLHSGPPKGFGSLNEARHAIQSLGDFGYMSCTEIA